MYRDTDIQKYCGFLSEKHFFVPMHYAASSQYQTAFTESIAQRCSVKKLFLKISQASKENNFVGIFFVYFFFSVIKKRLQHGCFPLNIAIF